jgi:hypothetical protein
MSRRLITEVQGYKRQREHGLWLVHFQVEKFEGDTHSHAKDPYEVIDGEKNLLVNTGIDEMWDLICGTGSPAAFSNANAYIGVGDSATAATASQTDLQASTNKLRKAMDSTYPQTATQAAVFKSTFGSSDANFAWQEWGIFNASTSGIMMNRRVVSLGTKVTATTWVHTATITLA